MPILGGRIKLFKIYSIVGTYTKIISASTPRVRPTLKVYKKVTVVSEFVHK